jgi:hypothetical protein
MLPPKQRKITPQDYMIKATAEPAIGEKTMGGGV